MRLEEEIEDLKKKGYKEEDAKMRLCQDIILDAISKSKLNHNITIKGGVVMRNVSNNIRRATQDIDFDFIRYSIDNNSINQFISTINNIDGITIKRIKRIEELNHPDYKGKRLYITISDGETTITSKIDVRVHTKLNIKQSEYCFDVCYKDDGVYLLMNTYEQMLVEKLKSFLRFKTLSTRYKDIFDIYYLYDKCNKEKVKKCIDCYIYQDDTLNIANSSELIKTIENTFTNSNFINLVSKSDKNWLNIDVRTVLEKDIKFIKQLLK